MRAADAKTNPKPALKEFSHKKYLALGNVALVTAQALDEVVYLSLPRDIRRFLNSGNPCQVCHNQTDPPDSCQFCHAANAALKPANHSPEEPGVGQKHLRGLPWPKVQLFRLPLTVSTLE